MRNLLLCIFLLSSAIFAEEAPETPHYELGRKMRDDQPENHPIKSTSHAITPKVDVVSGDYIEEAVDLVVAGIEPLSIRRFYSAQASFETRYGGWRYNPECSLFADFELLGPECFAALGESNGSINCYQTLKSKNFSFDIQKQKNYASYLPSGQTHPLNTKIQYDKEFSWNKQKHRYSHNKFAWVGQVVDGSGTLRSFRSEPFRWLRELTFQVRPNKYIKEEWIAGPRKWTPYQLPILEERKPNGNLICYTYETWMEAPWPQPPLLKSITAYNSTKTTLLGHIDITNHRKKNKALSALQVDASDERSALFTYGGKKNRAAQLCKTPDKPDTFHHYEGTLLRKIEKPEGRTFETRYDDQKRVTVQYAPVGPNGEIFPIANYKYYPDKKYTEVFDAENQKVTYNYDDSSRITHTTYHQDQKVVRIDQNQWDPATGNLLSYTMQNADGTPIFKKEFTYDKNQNPIQETNRDYVITRTFSDDGFNLKLSETDGFGKTTRYSYLPNTNLLASELIYDHDLIAARTFHTYDDCACCIKTLIDDGKSQDPDDISNITYRKILITHPKKQLPCLGLPEIIEEKTVDPYGQEILLKKTHYTYTPSGKVTQIDTYDSNNNYAFSQHFLYNDKNSIKQKNTRAQQTNPYNQDQLIAAIDPLGNQTNYTYDSNNNLIALDGPQSLHQEWIYDKADRPITEKNFLSTETLTTHKRYDKLGRVIATIDPSGNETQYTHDAFGNILTLQHPDGAREQKLYDLLGNPIQETDPNGYITKKSYNHQSQVTHIIHPDNTQEHYTYHPNGSLLTHTDTTGTTTHYQYDIFNHPTSVEVYSSEGNLLKKTTAAYTPFVKLSETDPEGITTHYTYDCAGRKTAQEKAGQKTLYFYDALGRLTQTQNEDTLYNQSFDLLNRLIEESTQDINGNLLYQQKYAYDSLGNRTHTLNSKGVEQTFYDTNNKPLWTKDPLGNLTQYIYQQGMLTKEINPKGIQTLHEYNKRLQEIVFLKKNPQDETLAHEEKSYDLNGNLIQQTHHIYKDAEPLNTITHQFHYGPQNRLEKILESGQKETKYLYENGRLSQKIKPDGTILHHQYDDLGRLSRYYSNDFDYNYIYDKNDRLLSVKDTLSQTTTSRSYDAHGNTTQEILATGLNFINHYNLQNQRIELVLPDGSSIHYHYKNDQLHQVERHGLSHVYTYDIDGDLTRSTLPASLGEIAITRDPLSRNIQLDTPFYHSIQTYDAVGNLIELQANNTLKTFAYDDLDQLIRENEHTYTYDSLNNRHQKDNHAYQINDLCQILHDGVRPHTYEENGNLTSNSECEFTYDAQDRLIGVQKDGQRVQYTYDPFHRRLSKTQNGETTFYLWDDNNEIGSIKGSDLQELRILGVGLGAEIGAAVIFELNHQTYIPIHDHRGNLISLINTATKELERYDYTAFGEELTGSETSPWRFASKRVDSETELVFFGRRYYSPTLGRWITPDPEGFQDGPNLYAYVHNRPLCSIDLYGLFSWGDCWDGCRIAGTGAAKYLWDMGTSFCYGMGKMGEWMHADFQYEHFDDPSFFREKSYSATEEWKALGHAARHDPLGLAIPGLMDALRMPADASFSDKAGAWGRGAVDIALIASTVFKGGQFAANAAKISRGAGLGGKALEIGEIANTGKGVMGISRGAESINAAVNLRKKLAQLEKAQQTAVNTRFLQDGRIRYYDLEIPSRTIGPTRGACNVLEWNPRTSQSRWWYECHDQLGNVNRVHPKYINGQSVSSPHYPLIGAELVE